MHRYLLNFEMENQRRRERKWRSEIDREKLIREITAANQQPLRNTE